jgi:hypothetical protein
MMIFFTLHNGGFLSTLWFCRVNISIPSSSSHMKGSRRGRLSLSAVSSNRIASEGVTLNCFPDSPVHKRPRIFHSCLWEEQVWLWAVRCLRTAKTSSLNLLRRLCASAKQLTQPQVTQPQVGLPQVHVFRGKRACLTAYSPSQLSHNPNQ